jgi:Icc-related predicted phosphoesterase
MKILVIADIHGDMDKLKKLVDETKLGDIDLVICPGDYTDMFETPKEFSQVDIANLLIQKLLSIKKPLLAVPGNHDPYEILEFLEDYGINLHGKKKTVLGTDFVGWGGAPTPFNTNFEPSEEETKEALDKLASQIKPGNFIMITHEPPKDTKLDAVGGGKHVGSPIIRKFIETARPVLVISAHIHESQGEDKIGSSILFYPGPLFDGYYGIVDIEGKNIKCEVRKLR